MKYIDTHCHLNDESLYPDRKEVVLRAKEKGCLAFYNNGDSVESFERILSLAREFPGFCSPVLGIHPEFATREDEYLQKGLEEIEAHAKDIPAIGEIGLDYHYSKDPEVKERQKALFREQIRLANRLSLPVVIHSRDADRDTFDLLREEKPLRTDLHCYSGSVELYEEYLRLPFEVFFGIGGVVTFKNARVLKEVVKKGRETTFLTETDSPFLTPSPHRGERNEPSYIPLILQAIAEIREENVEDVSRQLLENGEHFYGRNRD